MASIVDHASTATRLLLMGSEHDTSILAVGHAVGQGEPPTVMTGLRDATPIGDMAVFRNTAATWRRYDKMPRHLGGVVVIRDALCTLDPSGGKA